MMRLAKTHFGAWSQCWTMVGSHHIPVADVYSEHQGDGDHGCTSVFHSTSWWHHGKLEGPVPSPLGVLCELVADVGQFTRGSQEKRFRMIDFQFGAPATVAMSIQ